MQNVAETRPHEITDALYFAWQGDSYITDFIRLADTKAGAIPAVTVGVVGFLTERVTAQDGRDAWQWAFLGAALVADFVTILAAFLVWRRAAPSRGAEYQWYRTSGRYCTDRRRGSQRPA